MRSWPIFLFVLSAVLISATSGESSETTIVTETTTDEAPVNTTEETPTTISAKQKLNDFLKKLKQKYGTTTTTTALPEITSTLAPTSKKSKTKKATNTTTALPEITSALAPKGKKSKAKKATTTLPNSTTDKTLITDKQNTTVSITSTESTKSTKTPVTTIEPKRICGIRELDTEIHPWIVILEHTDEVEENRKKTFSKGVLISDRYVLTTVSSVHNSHAFWQLTRVRLGDFPVGMFRKISSYTPEFVEIEETILHPSKDIALIKLTKSVEFTELIQPICLPTYNGYDFSELTLHSCRKIRNKVPARVHIDALDVVLASPRDCTNLFRRNGAEFNSHFEFCSWDERRDTCTGDLGAPLIELRDGHYEVVGLASYATATRSIRGLSLPGVYTRVHRHAKWIEKVLKEDV